MTGIEIDHQEGHVRSRLADTLIHGRQALLDGLAGVRTAPAINQARAAKDMPASKDLAARLKTTLDDLKGSAMDENGATVNYDVLRDSVAYANYQMECQAALQHFNPDSLAGENARRAFWINLYNALVIDAVISFGVQQNVTEGFLGALSFFRRAAYLVDGRRVSLEDIEHGILRANRGNPFVPGAHFPSTDPRLAWCLPLDPRLHFALNCGGRSCPPIRSYSAEKLDQQLDLASQAFLLTTVEIRREQNQLLLSRIMQWYGGDFGDRDGILDFVVRHLPDDERRDYVIDRRSTLTLRYKKYDWRLNRA